MGVYQRALRKLADVPDLSRVEEFIPMQERQRLLLYFNEANELVDVVNWLRVWPNPELLKLVPEVVTGPVDQSAEVTGSSSNRPRNTLFELTIGTRLLAGGLPIIAHPRCDVVTEFEGMRLFIECKRPQSTPQADTAVRRGLVQLAKRISDHGGPARGVLALSASKLLTHGDRLLVASTADDISARMDLEADTLYRSVLPSLSRKHHPGIVGLLVHVSATGVAETEGPRLQTGTKFTQYAYGTSEERDWLRRFCMLAFAPSP